MNSEVHRNDAVPGLPPSYTAVWRSVRAAVRLCKEEAPPGTQMYLAAIAGS
jgi:hypothetical protein